MQPVERKPSTLKSVQIDHCSKLQQKYQQDIDLLDDLRLFMRQRAVIEKVYAHSLNKLVQQSLAKRQFPTKAVGETTDDGGQLSMTLLELWKHVMEETQNMAMVRMTAAETYEMKISEQCKQVRANRSQIAKMVFDELNSLQKDVSLSLQEMSKSQKLYRDEEHLAHEARVKAENINNKIKNRTIGRFSSLAKLQQQSSKIAARVEACEVKSTAARNEYILNLRAANAHLHRYYTNDLPDLMQALDGEYYDVWKHFLALLSTTEQHCGDVATQCFKRVAANIGKISRQHNNDCFLAENPVLTSMMQYPFLPQDNDPVTMVCKDHGSEIDLDLEREARKWATKIARENRTIRNVTKALSLLKEEKNKAMNSSSEFLVRSQFAVSESKLEEERNKLRLAEMGRAKAEARIEALREGGVEVDVWLNSASADVGTEDEDSNENGCVKSVESSDRTLTRPSQVPDTVLVPDEYATVNDLNNLRLRSDSKSMVYPIWCVAVYDYQAANADELSIQENENLQVLGEGTGDGWLRARNNQGVEGLVPENYIRVWNPVADSDTVDVNEENVDDGIVSPYAVEGILSPYAVNSQQLEIIEQADMAPYACNNPLMNVFHPAKLAHNPLYSEVPATVMLSEGEKWARALFDYEATCDEELSFQEGQLIRVISTENDGVDDGWWHGEVGGTIGLFPSLVVEELFPVDNHQDSNHISSSSSGQPQTSENLPANVYGNVPTTKTSSAPSDGAIIFTASSSRCAQESPAKIRLPPTNVQSLLNDGTESAV